MLKILVAPVLQVKHEKKVVGVGVEEIKRKMQICSFNWGLMVGITFPDIHKAYYDFYVNKKMY